MKDNLDRSLQDEAGVPIWQGPYIPPRIEQSSHILYPESMSTLTDEGLVVFRFSLDEDCWVGRSNGYAYKIYLHKWADVPYVHANLYGYQLRCVRPAVLYERGIVAMPIKEDRAAPEKVYADKRGEK